MKNHPQCKINGQKILETVLLFLFYFTLFYLHPIATSSSRQCNYWNEAITEMHSPKPSYLWFHILRVQSLQVCQTALLWVPTFPLSKNPDHCHCRCRKTSIAILQLNWWHFKKSPKIFKSFNGIAISAVVVSVAFLLLKSFNLNLKYLEYVKDTIRAYQ